MVDILIIIVAGIITIVIVNIFVYKELQNFRTILREINSSIEAFKPAEVLEPSQQEMEALQEQQEELRAFFKEYLG